MAVSVVLAPEQIVVFPEIEAVGAGKKLTVVVAVPVQPVVAVTVTVYVPAVEIVVLAVVEPLLQMYVPPPVAVKMVELVPQTVVFPEIVMATVFTVTVTEAVPVQPFASVTVTT